MFHWPAFAVRSDDLITATISFGFIWKMFEALKIFSVIGSSSDSGNNLCRSCSEILSSPCDETSWIALLI